MHFLLTLVTIIFVFIMLTFALSLSVFLLMWFVGVSLAGGAIFFVRERARRWLFLHRGREIYPQKPQPPIPPRQPGEIIDAEFVEVKKRW
jgi:hypothetical protein